MSLELELQQFPKEIKLKDGLKAKLRPLKRTDEKAFHALFQTIPEKERMFIKASRHRPRRHSRVVRED